MKKLILPVLGMLFIGSCQKSDCKDAVKATFVDKTGFDGCGMVVQLENDEFLEPKNLDQISVTPEDGMKVWMSYTVVPGSSICMIGEMIEVDCVEKR